MSKIFSCLPGIRTQDRNCAALLELIGDVVTIYGVMSFSLRALPLANGARGSKVFPLRKCRSCPCVGLDSRSLFFCFGVLCSCFQGSLTVLTSALSSSGYAIENIEECLIMLTYALFGSSYTNEIGSMAIL